MRQPVFDVVFAPSFEFCLSQLFIAAIFLSVALPSIKSARERSDERSDRLTLVMCKCNNIICQKKVHWDNFFVNRVPVKL